jgi:Family of unknown function (DUF6159)
MSRFKTSWTIIRHALGLMRRQKALLVFPLLQTAAAIVIFAFFIAPLALNFAADRTSPPWTALSVLPVIAGYLFSMFAATFINVAFYSEILNALNGDDVSLTRGFGLARSKVRAIVAWSLFAGTVGLLIRAVQDKLGLVGQWVAALAGLSWSVASVFVIPVMIKEGRQKSPFEYLRISASLIRRTWGEGIIGFAGIALVGFLVVIGAVFVVGRIVFWIGSLQAAAAGFLVVAGIAYLFAIATQIFRCSLYVYATEGVAPGAFDADFFGRVWKVQKRSGE